eukprot:CAMPEP_0117435036 /NCGR_PEP_ID=MMETSP0759-20121206/265_1 /TAXON_ID=63605 /ORGANISM="Percolomonas cosmopolitus, Strain WS" /LENGTH=295 /DNA_ID=CAMNT_0005226553 /DNA_START=1160 /DNA_END=2045 /DNA_ORIENTATION=-
MTLTNLLLTLISALLLMCCTFGNYRQKFAHAAKIQNDLNTVVTTSINRQLTAENPDDYSIVAAPQNRSSDWFPVFINRVQLRESGHPDMITLTIVPHKGYHLTGRLPEEIQRTEARTMVIMLDEGTRNREDIDNHETWHKAMWKMEIKNTTGDWEFGFEDKTDVKVLGGWNNTFGLNFYLVSNNTHSNDTQPFPPPSTLIFSTAPHQFEWTCGKDKHPTPANYIAASSTITFTSTTFALTPELRAHGTWIRSMTGSYSSSLLELHCAPCVFCAPAASSAAPGASISLDQEERRSQ